MKCAAHIAAPKGTSVSAKRQNNSRAGTVASESKHRDPRVIPRARPSPASMQITNQPALSDDDLNRALNPLNIPVIAAAVAKAANKSASARTATSNRRENLPSDVRVGSTRSEE